MKMKWEKSRIDIYNIASIDVIAVSGDDDLGEQPEDWDGNN